MDEPILGQLSLWPDGLVVDPAPQLSQQSPNLHTYWRNPDLLPALARQSPTVMRCLDLQVAL